MLSFIRLLSLSICTGAVFCQYIYPNPNVISFNDGDTVIVAYDSQFSAPFLEFVCLGQNMSYQPQAPGSGAVSVQLTFGIQTSCYFIVSEQQNKLISPVFNIGVKADVANTYYSSNVSISNMTETDHFDEAALASISAVIASKASIATTVTAPPPATTVSQLYLTAVASVSDANSSTKLGTAPARRPVVTLASDVNGSATSFNGYNCLDNEADFQQQCWAALNITEWLPAWV